MGNIKEGDIVYLKSGSPDMTVLLVSKVMFYAGIQVDLDDYDIITTWFDKNNELKQHTFKESVLIKKDV